MNNILMMSNSKSALFTATLTSGGSGISFGYTNFGDGVLSNTFFESLEISLLRWWSLSSRHILSFSPNKPSPDLNKIKIDGIEYPLTIEGPSGYFFNVGPSLFSNGSIHEIEFIR